MIKEQRPALAAKSFTIETMNAHKPSNEYHSLQKPGAIAGKRVNQVVRLNRNQLAVLLALLVITFNLANRAFYIMRGEITAGSIADLQSLRYRQKDYSQQIPVVRFWYKETAYEFKSVANLSLTPGDSVRVLFLPHKPEKAWIYSFGGFWLEEVIISTFVYLVVLAFTLAMVGRSEILIVDLGIRPFQLRYRIVPREISFLA